MAATQGMKGQGWMRRLRDVLLLVTLLACTACSTVGLGWREPTSFSTPEEAVDALVKALDSDNLKDLKAILGPGSEDLIYSGDPVADNVGRERFVSLHGQQNRLEYESADKVVLHLGPEDWPFSIPVVREDGRWHFDGDEGWEELLARRVGRNELSVIQVCLAYVDAQREYALKDRDEDGLLAYAEKFVSDSGKNNGLYWETEEGETQSPLGPLVVGAQAEGYAAPTGEHKPVPYHGYYYRILEAQGPNAPGGAYDYVIRGEMVGGFALVAYPAEYGASGIMTFIVSHDGVVYQQDLGENTEHAALAMKLFDPDSRWRRAD